MPFQCKSTRSSIVQKKEVLPLASSYIHWLGSVALFNSVMGTDVRGDGE